MGAEYMGALARFPLSCLHVRTNQLTKMFWGLIVEPGRKYSQTVENSFHISKATVDLSSVTDEDITLLLDYEGQQEYILCHLNKSIKQESLDLNFQAGDVISLFTQGKGSIHLSGYLLGEDEDDDMTLGEMMEEEGEDEDEECEEEEEEEVVEAKGNKRPMPVNGQAMPQKKKKMEVDAPAPAEEKEPTKSKNQKKKERKQQQKAQAPAEEVKSPVAAAPAKKNNAESKTPAEPATKKLAGGLIIEDIKVGTGLTAASGQKVAVYYEGRLQKNNKKFDQSKKGPGFKFNLGAGEVIKGWDVGVAGKNRRQKENYCAGAHGLRQRW